MDALEHLPALEASLWVAETRFNRDHMERVLHPDFAEFGRSGRVHGRGDVLSTTSAAPRARNEDDGIGAELPPGDVRVSELAPGVVLLTYRIRVHRQDVGGVEVSNRSSIWLLTEDGWRLRFHQGTPC
jgi:hypothetical protein